MPPSPSAAVRVTEIFHSIQGESTLAGVPFSFVRLTGCPLRCTYCDTTYSFQGGKTMALEEIVREVEGHGTEWVLITGGEPLVQKNVSKLVEMLVCRGRKVSIETSGEVDVSPVAGRAKLILDIKTPGSGEVARMCFENLERLYPSDEIKFVVTSEADYQWAMQIAKEHKLAERFTVLLSPVQAIVTDSGVELPGLSLRVVAEWMLRDRWNVRLQPQLHRWIWGAQIRGV